MHSIKHVTWNATVVGVIISLTALSNSDNSAKCSVVFCHSIHISKISQKVGNAVPLD